MEKTSKLFKPEIVVGGVLTGLLIFNAFKRKRQNDEVSEIQNWLNWEVEFKENATEDEKAAALLAIDKHIMDAVDTTTSSVTFTHIPVRNGNSVIVIARHEWAQQAVAGKKPVPPKPHFPRILDFFNVKNFKNIDRLQFRAN